MPTTARPQQRYNHRLRNLIQRTEDMTIATDLGVPRSTARAWLGKTPKIAGHDGILHCRFVLVGVTLGTLAERR